MANNLNTIFLYFVLAILPGMIWLSIFLKKDNLPEPKMKIMQIFYFGVFVAVPAVLIELWLLSDFKQFSFVSLSSISYFLFKNILIIGLIEELLKYFVVRYFVLKKSCMDEPIDIPLYMIISALGFATAENILLFTSHQFTMITEPFVLSLIRFLGANLLHVLCSGIIGIFLAWSFYQLKYRWLFIVFGFSLGIIVHGLFDFFLESSIIELSQNDYIVVYPAVLLIICFCLLNFSFNKIKKLKSVCIIK
ncbi:MAG: PrsW family glutamic-type intramembrane protease [Candidatus Paceibacterota bacterium]